MILTEALDYCEWKNGYRTEGTTLAAQSVVRKVAGTFISPLNSLMMKRIGYSLGAGFGAQSEKTKFYLFALCTVLPGLTGLLGAVPKLFYDLNGETRDRMFAELAVVREKKRRELALIHALPGEARAE